jgi:DNA polymerase-3 subunit epsilon
MLLFTDTETTGFPTSAPLDDPSQPRMVQLAAMLCDDDGRKRAVVDVIIRPEGWVIPEGVIAVHGIDNALAKRVGIYESAAVTAFWELVGVEEPATVVAHNVGFDLKIIRSALMRKRVSQAHLDWFVNVPTFCTLQAGRQWAQAGEKCDLRNLYRLLFGRNYQGAHDAMGDVIACREVYFGLKRLERKAMLERSAR